MVRKLLYRLAKALLLVTTIAVVLGAAAAGLPRAFGLRAEAVPWHLGLPGLVLAQATGEVIPGNQVLFADQEERTARLYRVLGLQRSGNRQTLIVADARSGEPLPTPVLASGDLLVARAVLPLLGYGHLALTEWPGRLAALLVLGLALGWLWTLVVGGWSDARRPADGRVARHRAGRRSRPAPLPSPPAEEPPTPPGVVAPVEATAHAEAGEAVVAAAAEQAQEPAPAWEPAPAQKPVTATVGVPSGETADEDSPLEGDLMAIFQKVASQVRERTLASEVEEVPVTELLDELRALRRRLRP